MFLYTNIVNAIKNIFYSVALTATLYIYDDECARTMYISRLAISPPIQYIVINIFYISPT